MEGPIKGGSRDPTGTARGFKGPRNGCPASWKPLVIARTIARRGRSGAEIGLGAAGTLHSAAFGRCPHPAGTTIRPDRRRRQAHAYSAARACQRDDPRGCGGLRALELDPGAGRMVPRRAHRPAPSPSCSEAATSSQGARGAPAHRGERMGGVRAPMAPPPWSWDAAAGSSGRWWPACPTLTTALGGTVRPLRRRPPRLQ